MSFDTDKRKLKKIDDNLNQSNNLIQKINIVDFSRVFNSSKKNNFYCETEWSAISNYPFYEHLVFDFGQDLEPMLLPDIKVNCVFKTEDAYTDILNQILFHLTTVEYPTTEIDIGGNWFFQDFSTYWELDADTYKNHCLISAVFGDWVGYDVPSNELLPLYYKIIMNYQEKRDYYAAFNQKI